MNRRERQSRGGRKRRERTVAARLRAAKQRNMDGPEETLAATLLIGMALQTMIDRDPNEHGTGLLRAERDGLRAVLWTMDMDDDPATPYAVLAELLVGHRAMQAYDQFADTFDEHAGCTCSKEGPEALLSPTELARAASIVLGLVEDAEDEEHGGPPPFVFVRATRGGVPALILGRMLPSDAPMGDKMPFMPLAEVLASPEAQARYRRIEPMARLRFAEDGTAEVYDPAKDAN